MNSLFSLCNRCSPSPRYTSVTAAVVIFYLLSGLPSLSWAGSATWALDATETLWNYAPDWTPQVIPNGPDDIATFSVSNYRTPYINSSDVEVNSIVFDSSADTFEIIVLGTLNLTLSGAGIVNNSGQVQSFSLYVVTSDPFGGSFLHFRNGASAGNLVDIFVRPGMNAGNGSFLTFADSSSAGSATVYNYGGSNANTGGATTSFAGHSSAANATFTEYGGDSIGGAGHVEFSANSTADHATFTNNALPAEGGSVQFYDSATAAEGSFTNNGTYRTGGASGATAFFDSSSAGDAILIANSDSATGGLVQFSDASDGDTCHVQVFGYGSLDLSGHAAPGVTIGSLEGDGQVFLGSNNLSVGSNDTSAAFSGVIQDGGLSGGTGGSLSKVGDGTLVLSGANTYAGGTTVEAGTLLVQTKRASATGSGAVQVNGGTLGGRGKMAGAVTIGSGTGSGAILAPGTNGPAGLTTQSSLAFNSDGTYNCQLDTTSAKADKVTAKGVTINGGAQFAFRGKGTTALPEGTVFTVIDNRTRQPIAGVFANLADGSIFTANGNTFQASYEGGNGNDLTLTVVP